MTEVGADRADVEAQLRELAEQFRGIFETTSEAMFITDLEGYVVDANPAAGEMYGWSREELVARRDRALGPSHIEAITATGSFRGRAIDRRADGTLIHVEGTATRFTYRGRPHFLVVARDVTERVTSQEQLEERVRERTQELSTLLDVSRNVASTLELQPLLGLILDQLKVVAQYSGAALFQMQDETLTVLVRRAPGPDPRAGPASSSLEKSGLLWERLGNGETVVIDDVRGDTPLAHAYQAAVGDFLETAFAYERSWLAVPMVAKDRVMGVLTLSYNEPGYYTSRHVELTRAIATQAAVAIENARLYEQMAERTRELSTLLDISHAVASTLELQPLLGLILDQLKIVASYSGSGIVVLEGDDLRVIGYRGPIPQEIALQARFPAEGSLVWEFLKRREPAVIADVRGDTPLARSYQEVVGDELDTTYRYVSSFMAVPMVVKDRVIGGLTLESSEPHAYTSRHVALAQAISQQAAVAVENARLYVQAQELAALEERQRLARELHDSVTQALFGIRIGVHTARALFHRDPDKALESLEYVHTLAQGGMAEMRALLFELRPESLAVEGLVVALQKQAEALTARHEVPVKTTLGKEPAVSLQIKEALYRIAQEALQNTFKHAHPSRVEVSLECFDGDIVLEIQDDGVGFDTAGSFPGHLGLQSMRERATRLGGSLEIESAPGRGTRVRALIPVVHLADPPSA